MGYLDGTGLSHLISKIKAAFWSKTDVVQISIDNTPTESSNNLVKSGGVYSALSGKYEKPSGGIPAADIAAGVIPTVPTISTDIQTDKTSTTMTASPSAVYNEVHPAIATIQPAGGFLPNVVYDLGTLSGSQSFTLATASDATIANAYHWTFETGSTAPSVTWPTGVIWPTGFEPTINANCHYEVLDRKGYITMLEFDLS